MSCGAIGVVGMGAMGRGIAEVAARAKHFVQTIDKTSVMVSDTSGYIVNRLLVPYLLDALRALEAHVAAAEAIDAAMKLGCAHPMGPRQLSDAIGLDVVYAMAKTMHKELGEQRFSPPPLLRRLVLAGHLGKKSRLGVYDYSVHPPRVNSRLWPSEVTDQTASQMTTPEST